LKLASLLRLTASSVSIFFSELNDFAILNVALKLAGFLTIDISFKIISLYVLIFFHSSELNSFTASFTIPQTDKAITIHLFKRTCISFQKDKSKSTSHFTNIFQSSVILASFQTHTSEKILSQCSIFIGITHQFTESYILFTASSENLSESLSIVESVAIHSIINTLDSFDK
jgi:hypothetical protein